MIPATFQKRRQSSTKSRRTEQGNDAANSAPRPLSSVSALLDHHRRSIEAVDDPDEEVLGEEDGDEEELIHPSSLLEQEEADEVDFLVMALSYFDDGDDDDFLDISFAPIEGMVHEDPPESVSAPMDPLLTFNQANYPQENAAYFLSKSYCRNDKYELREMLRAGDAIPLPDIMKAFEFEW